MPTPRKEETETEFVQRCIPIVLNEGTASDSSQAAAICRSLYKTKTPCYECNGRGQLSRAVLNSMGTRTIKYSTCTSCNGEGVTMRIG